MREIGRIITISALAAAAAQAQAQGLNQTIVGCVEVECPASSQDTANDNCTVADTGSFTSVGLTRAPVKNSSALAGLSWVKGFNITDSEADGRSFHSSFFLGKPPDLDISVGTGACAIFLHGVSESLSFGQNATTDTAYGTCSDAMGSSCVNAVVARAESVAAGFIGGGDGDRPANVSDACARIQRDLEDHTESACLPVTRGSWTNVTAVALTGDGAPQPLSQQQNSSSACWPVIPKQDDLTLVSEYHTQGSLEVEDAQRAQWAITPILTVFYRMGDGSVVTDFDASLSCVKAMGPARASLDTISSNGTDDQGSGAAGFQSSQPWLSTLLGAIVAAAFALYVI
ncbi:hypothetical protein AAE478_009428 [Parahypoxylon ruwenzoriense]